MYFPKLLIHGIRFEREEVDPAGVVAGIDPASAVESATAPPASQLKVVLTVPVSCPIPSESGQERRTPPAT
jgi:hypothetical protein